MTINEYRINAIAKLSAISDNAEFEADQLMQFALNKNKNELVVCRRDTLSDEEIVSLDGVISRRMAREPLQYICGEWEFFGLRMFCGDGCLIPRTETEMLVDYIIKHLPKGGHFVDLCTGSGCIAVSVLNNRPDATATAVDISEDALFFARKNAKYHGISDSRIEFVCCDVREYTPKKLADIIVSNPPYIKTGDIPGLEPEVHYEPYIALDGGLDGLDFYKVIATKFEKNLNDGGEVVLEVGYDIAGNVADVFNQNEFEADIVKDIFGVERMCVAKKN